MYRKTEKTKVMQTVGVYTIVKSIEQLYWDNGERFGSAEVWYDICLNGGDGDIVASFDRLNEAQKWVRSN